MGRTFIPILNPICLLLCGSLVTRDSRNTRVLRLLYDRVAFNDSCITPVLIEESLRPNHGERVPQDVADYVVLVDYESGKKADEEMQ